jgi:hypothetical protein
VDDGYKREIERERERERERDYSFLQKSELFLS